MPTRVTAAAQSDVSLNKGETLVLSALAWWAALGFAAPSKKQVAAVVGVVPGGSTMRGYLAKLVAAGLVEYVKDGIGLTDAGTATAPEPENASLHEFVRRQLNASETSVFNGLVEAGGSLSREDLGALMNVEPKGSTMRGYLAALSKLELIEYERDGAVSLQSWVE